MVFARRVFLFTSFCLSAAALLWASSHREAPAISFLPAVDNTDVYAFVSYEEGQSDSVTLVANFSPLEAAAAGPNFYKFDPNATYEIHIDNDGDAVEEITYQFKFRTEVLNGNTFLLATGPIDDLNDDDYNVRQFYEVTRLDAGGSTVLGSDLIVPPPNVGLNSTPDYESLADAAIHDLGNGSRVFAGPREDPFFADLGKIFDLLQVADPGIDYLAGFNVHSIILEVPIADLTRDGSVPSTIEDPSSVIGVWSTARLPLISLFPRGGGAAGGLDFRRVGLPLDTQVSRLGMPLVNEVVIPLGYKDRFNASHPRNDAQFLNFVTNPELGDLLNALFGLAVPATPRNDLVEVFLTGLAGLNQPPNVAPSEMLRLNTAVPPVPLANQDRLGVLAGDQAGFPNGRRPVDDTVDIALQVAAGILVDGTGQGLGDGVDTNDVSFLDQFPYLAPPQPGNAP